jgi:hypothetical protein
MVYSGVRHMNFVLAYGHMESVGNAAIYVYIYIAAIAMHIYIYMHGYGSNVASIFSREKPF